MDSSITLIENVPVNIDMAAAAKKLGIKPGQTKFEKTLERLAGVVLEKARPRAVARLCNIKAIDENNVEVEGVRITSPLLREKTEGLSRVFTFVSTEGVELAKWADHLESSLELVFTGILREFVCKGYQKLLEEAICEKYGIPQVSCMNPGSLKVWPIEQQVELFKTLSPYSDQIGVTLLPSYLMYPAYSVSGIYFQTDTKYYNCQLCPREGCPNRKAPSTVI